MTAKTLTIVLATRMRPGTLVRTVNATLPNIALPTTKLVICCDLDDVTVDTIKGKITPDERVKWYVMQRADSLGGKYNAGCKAFPADVYLAMTDYAPHMVKGFDARIVEAANVYPDGYAAIVNHLVCAVDAKQPGNMSFCQINAATHKLVEAMGGLYPEIFPYWFVDHWFEDIATMIGRKVFADVVCDGSKRPGTMDLREPEFWGNIFDWLTQIRNGIAEKIISSPDFEETPARKVALIRNFILTAQRSMAINAQLRGMPQGEIDDERYIRIRQRAIDMRQNLMDQAAAHQKAQEAEQQVAAA